MTERLLKRLIFLFLLLAPVFVFAAQKKEALEPLPAAVAAPAKIMTIVLHGTVNPGSADYFIRSLDSAANSGFDALLIQLDTPGGLVESTRDIVKAFFSAKIPVIVYVAPTGAHAGSAGVMITMAAHVAAMAPGTNIGAAHPVGGGGEEMDETMKAKITNDTAAWIEGIAEQRGRNKEWAVKAVRDSVAVTASKALEVKVIDLVADSVEDLMTKIDGREILLADGKKVTLRTRDARVVYVAPGLKHRLLMRLADPNIAYILMIVGFLGIYAEFSHPGLLVPGIIGAISLLLFFMSTQVLPINLTGIILIVLAMGMFIAEIKVASHGFLTIGGAAALALGSIFLFQSPEKIVDYPNFSLNVSWALILPVTVGFTLIAALIAFLVIRSQRRRPQTGQEALIGGITHAESDINADGGRVKLQGIFWTAVSDEPIAKGQEVRVVSANAASVTVAPVEKVVK